MYILIFFPISNLYGVLFLLTNISCFQNENSEALTMLSHAVSNILTLNYIYRPENIVIVHYITLKTNYCLKL